MPDCVFVQQLMRKLKLTIAFIQVVVWYSRNKLVRGGIKPVVDESVSFIVAFIHEQDNLGRVFTNPSATHDLVCKRVGLFKGEGDSLTVIKKLNSDVVDWSLIYPTLHDIKILPRDFNIISFCFFQLRANNVAHALARECEVTLVRVSGWRKLL
ncbi:hypothetical protein V6N12_007917 [Hibiscus sabdariffa]|uniref:RNase H type-1 domain-containing protein n=1 Tax=Hibiscus sabdariffa TaxID=183260 RepID=A0ABR2ANJ8_9ROSI